MKKTVVILLLAVVGIVFVSGTTLANERIVAGNRDTVGGIRWYFAEGSTWEGFDEWILIQNVHNSPSEMYIKFVTPEGVEGELDIIVEPTSRKTVHVNDFLPKKDVSTLICVTNNIPVFAERAMYFNTHDKWGSHTCTGSMSTANEWYLVEGCTRYGFDEWVMIMNPAEPKNIPPGYDGGIDTEITFVTPYETVEGPKFKLEPLQRKTIHVNDYVPNADVATVIRGNNEYFRPVAERAMYVNTTDGKVGCHASLGLMFGNTRWYLAEGATWPGMEEWVLIMNTAGSVANVKVSFFTPTGVRGGPSFDLAPNQRYQFRVNDFIANQDVSVMLESTQGIVAERSMYFNSPDKRGCHNEKACSSSGGNYCCFAEGCTLPGYEEWVLIANISEEESAEGGVKFLLPDGLIVNGPHFNIPFGSRYTVRVNDYVMDSVSTIVETTSGKIVGERAMYMVDPVYTGGKTGCTDSIGSTNFVFNF